MNRRLSVFVIMMLLLSMLPTLGNGVKAEESTEQNHFLFDFGSASSPVDEGYIQVHNQMLYTAERGYGLNKIVDFRDRGEPDFLNRDFIINNDFEFIVDIANGDYYVKIIAGDQIAFNRTGITIQGESKGNISSSAASYAEYEEVISVENNQLVFRFTDNGRVNGLTIIPMADPVELQLKDKQLTSKPSITLKWKEVEGASNYSLYRLTGNEKEYEKIGYTDQTNFTDNNVQLGHTYRYVATSINESGHESMKSEELKVNMIDAEIAVPQSPTGLAVQQVLGDSITLSWKPAQEALYHYVLRAKAKDGPYTQIGITKEPRYKDNEVLTYQNYYYKIFAVNAGGFSEQSEAVKTPISQVTLRQMEKLDRGLVAVKTNEGIYLGWRLLGTDPDNTRFDLYRDGEKVNETPIASSTNYIDANGTEQSSYQVKAYKGKSEELSDSVSVWSENHLSIPLDKPEGGVTPDGVQYEYTANDASVGDVDGDGEYEIILKWDPTNAKDNSHSGHTGNVYIDAYKLDGTKLWRIDLGKNIRAGAHYTQFLVYDFDGDGKSEVVMKTADGTMDGQGNIIGDPNADYRNNGGYILAGPEYLTVFEGETGKALDTTDYYPPRGNVNDWGDGYGNRVDRFLAGVAYLDGVTPSFVMARGYYTRAVLAAYEFKNGKIQEQWVFDSDDPGNEAYRGQGTHSLSVADVDGDGKDEIIYGASVIDHDGTGLYSTGWGHGDALHVSDFNPNRPGLEIYQAHEDRSSPVGYSIRDAETGELLFGVQTGTDVGRALIADIDPRYDGAEFWASYSWDGSVGGGLHSVEGESISNQRPRSINHAIWWDGDLLRELLDHNLNTDRDPHGVGKIEKWNWEKEELETIFVPEGTRSNNWTKGNPSLQADLFGDWREEVIWPSADSTELRIYTTTDVTVHRIYTLMHDPVYRLSIAWQNVAYNQPPHTGFFLGHGMEDPPTPAIYTKSVEKAPVKMTPKTLNLKSKGGENTFIVNVQLPDRLAGNKVDESSIQLRANGKTIFADSAEHIGNSINIKYDRSKVIEAFSEFNGSVELHLNGFLDDGTTFEGKDEIKIIH